jgi:hypothetical protein
VRLQEPVDRGFRDDLLTGRHVHAASIYYVGKESNFLEEVESGFLHDLDDVQQKYLDPNQDPWTLYAARVLRDMPRAELAHRADISARYVQFLRWCKRRPSRSVRAKLTRVAGDFAREQLGPYAPTDDIAACAAYLESRRVGHQWLAKKDISG